MTMIDRGIGVGVGAGVGVGKGDPAVPDPSGFAGRWLALEPEVIGERVVLVRVAVGPSIDGDPENVSGRIEPAGA